MVKKVIALIFILQLILWAENNRSVNVYEQNCIPCHKPLSIGLEKIFFRYLLKYSSEVSVKSALIYFLKHPNRYTSAMSDEQIRRFGIKSKTILNEKELKEAIDIYWEEYQVFERLY